MAAVFVLCDCDMFRYSLIKYFRGIGWKEDTFKEFIQICSNFVSMILVTLVLTCQLSFLGLGLAHGRRLEDAT